MISKRTGWLFAGALLLASGVSNAEMLTFNFRGTVTYGGTLANVGDEVTGNFCYDTDTVAGIKLQGYATFQPAKPCKIVLRVGEHKAIARNMDVAIWNDSGGNIEDMIIISGGYSMLLDGAEYPDGNVDLVLATGPGETKEFRSLNLREQFKIGDFDAANYGEVRADGTQTGQLLQFTITSMKAAD